MPNVAAVPGGKLEEGGRTLKIALGLLFLKHPSNVHFASPPPAEDVDAPKQARVDARWQSIRVGKVEHRS